MIAARPEDPISMTSNGLQVTSEPSLLTSFRGSWALSLKKVGLEIDLPGQGSHLAHTPAAEVVRASFLWMVVVDSSVF